MRICLCGSGLLRYPLKDARGIFCDYVCQSCEAEKKKLFRSDIFEDAFYFADEPVDED